VLIYHNSNPKVKLLKKKDLLAYDVIMISCMSQTIESCIPMTRLTSV